MTTVRLNPHDLMPESEQTEQVDNKTPVVLSLSAYDLPQAVTVKREEGRIEIRFQYPDNEQDDVVIVGSDLSVILGKNSRKVLGFTVSGGREPKEVTVRVVQGVDAQIRLAQRDNQRMNYRVIRRVMADRLEPLLAGA